MRAGSGFDEFACHEPGPAKVTFARPARWSGSSTTIQATNRQGDVIILDPKTGKALETYPRSGALVFNAHDGSSPWAVPPGKATPSVSSICPLARRSVPCSKAMPRDLNAPASSPDRKILASGRTLTRCAPAVEYRPRTRRSADKLACHTAAIDAVAFSPDRRTRWRPVTRTMPIHLGRSAVGGSAHRSLVARACDRHGIQPQRPDPHAVRRRRLRSNWRALIQSAPASSELSRSLPPGPAQFDHRRPICRLPISRRPAADAHDGARPGDVGPPRRPRR